MGWGDIPLISLFSGEIFGLGYCRDWKLQKCGFPPVYSKPVTSTDSYVLLVNEFFLTGGLLFRGQQTTAGALITWVYWWCLLGLACFGISEDFWRGIPSFTHTHILVVVLCLLKSSTPSEGAQHGHWDHHKRRCNFHQFWSTQHFLFFFFHIKLHLWYHYIFVISDEAMNFFMLESLRTI